MSIYTDDPFWGLANDPYTTAFGQPEPEHQELEWYDDVALSIDPTRGSAYDYTMSLMKDLGGVDEHDGMQDYTYFGLPAEGAAPNNLEDFE